MGAMGHLCTTALFLLVASAQARFIVLTDHQDGAMASESDTWDRSGHEAAWTTSNGGPLTMDSWHLSNPLSWFLGGSSRVATRDVALHESPMDSIVQDMLKHVRCQRLKAALAEYQAAMQSAVEGPGQGAFISSGSSGQDAYSQDAYDRQSEGALLQHSSALGHHSSQEYADDAANFDSNQHTDADNVAGPRIAQGEYADDQVYVQQLATQHMKQTTHTTTTTTSSSRDMDGSDWDRDGINPSDGYAADAYAADDAISSMNEMMDAPDSLSWGRETEELYPTSDQVDSLGTDQAYSSEAIRGDGYEEEADNDAASTQSIVSIDEAAALQRDLDGMLDNAGSEADSNRVYEDGLYERDHDDATPEHHSTASATDVTALVTHLLRGMAVAAEHAQSVAAEAASDAAADAEVMGDNVVLAHATDHDMLIPQEEEEQEEEEEAGSSMMPHAVSSGASHDMLLLYPYDGESDDVFALRGGSAHGGQHAGISLFFNPLSYAAHVMHELAAKVEVLWALQQHQDAVHRASAALSGSSTFSSSGLLPRILDDQVLLDTEEATQYMYKDHPNSASLAAAAANLGVITSHGSSSGSWPSVTGPADDPMFLSSWWVPGSSGYVADAGQDEYVDGEGRLLSSNRGPLEWALVTPEGEVNLGVLLLCALLLATAAMTVGFVRSLWSLRRVMRHGGREPLLVPFIVEGSDGYHQQGYMLLDEEALVGAAAAAGMGRGNAGQAKGCVAGAREWLGTPMEDKPLKEGLEVERVGDEKQQQPQGKQ